MKKTEQATLAEEVAVKGVVTTFAVPFGTALLDIANRMYLDLPRLTEKARELNTLGLHPETVLPIAVLFAGAGLVSELLAVKSLANLLEQADRK